MVLQCSPLLKRFALFLHKSKNPCIEKLTLWFLLFGNKKDGLRWDEYGAYIDTDRLLDDEAKQSAQSAMSSRTSNIADPTLATTTPTPSPAQAAAEEDDIGSRKKVTVSVQVAVACLVKSVDFDGRASGGDLMEIVKAFKPTKLVVVRASLRDSERFAKECQVCLCWASTFIFTFNI